MAKNKNTYTVNIDMKWSMDYIIKAETAAEAKRMAWERFKSNPHKKLFEIQTNKN